MSVNPKSGGDNSFVDTNLLLYSFDPADPAKHESAKLWLEFLWNSGTGRISWQVLNEFYANAERKLKIRKVTARKAVEDLTIWQPAGFNMESLTRAWHWMDRAGVSYWDGLILASAESLGCRWLLSEDFQSGRQYGTVRAVNPFRSSPPEFVEQQVQ